MLSMKEKTLIGFVIVFVAAVAANFIIPVRTFEVRLVTNPATDGIFAPARQPLNVTCQGLGDDGSKFHSIRWLNTKGNVIPEGAPGVKKHGESSLQLVFTDPKPEESGTYKCIAGYDNKNTLEKTIKITFYGDKPFFEVPSENITVEEGSDLEVNCSAIGDETVRYEWYKYEDRIPEYTNGSSIYVLDYGSRRSVLVIPEVSKSDEGMYVCLAKHGIEIASKMYWLTVLPSRDNGGVGILSVEAESITSTSVRFAIEVSGNPRSIEVKYTEKRLAANISKTWDYTNSDNYEVEDLIPGGSYTFRFRTVPPNNSAWSREYQVVLLPGIPQVIFHHLNEGSLTIGWFSPVDEILRKTIEGYELKYFSVQMIEGNYWKESGCAITVQIPDCAGNSYTIAELYRHTYYEIQLRARTSSGFGEAYRQKIFTLNN